MVKERHKKSQRNVNSGTRVSHLIKNKVIYTQKPTVLKEHRQSRLARKTPPRKQNAKPYTCRDRRSRLNRLSIGTESRIRDETCPVRGTPVWSEDETS